ETLADLEAHGAKTIALDVTSSQISFLPVMTMHAKSGFTSGQVDYLVNNTGFGQGDAIEEVSPIEVLAQFNTDFFGLASHLNCMPNDPYVNTTNTFPPHFRSWKAGTIVNISSEVTCNPNPGASIYCASKTAVNAVSDTW
ncbi:hypothetical protein B0H10DRAFT_1687710, partial [Mycena sp. CBHHK59/15]